MSTPATPTDRGQRRKDELLAVAVDYLLEHGLTDFSLRQVAKRAGTSHRMLLYHFGSQAELLRAALTSIRQPFLEHATASAGDPLTFAAQTFADDSPASRVLLQGLLQAGIDPEQYGAIAVDYVEAYLPIIASQLPESLPARDDLAALILCAFRGALLDVRSTGDSDRASRALALLAQLVSGAAATPA